MTGRRFSQLSISIRFVPYPDQPASEVHELQLHSPLVDLEEASATLKAALKDSNGYHVSHVLDARAEDFSWGASNTFGEIVLYVTNAAASGVIYDALKAALRGIRDEFDDSKAQGLLLNPFTVEEAVQRARWTVIRRFDLGIDNDALSVRGTEEKMSPHSVVVQLEHAGVQYSVEVEEFQGLASTVMVKVEYPD